MNIRDAIVANRRRRIRGEGHSLGAVIPARRQTPLVPFGAAPGVICEVKRRSPSRGDISSGLDPLKQVSLYAGAGITSVSVLTEEDHFSGSLDDLIAIKRAFPHLSVLRKDFLMDQEDIEISYRAGADAVLLIASILDSRTLLEMHRHAVDLGMAALVEVHDDADIEKVRLFAPSLVGINSRDLETFAVDPIRPIALKAGLDWGPKLVYESGIRGEEDARLASASGFDCLLVGEAVVRNAALIPEIVRGKEAGGGAFWADLYDHRGRQRGEIRPRVKICGLTHAGDVEAAIDLGADALGFVFARSPRRADPGLLRSLGARRPDEPVRVGVVVSTDPPDRGGDAFELLEEGLIDAVQFHGSEEPEECYRKAFPYYKALHPATAAEAETIESYHCPRVLIDASLPGTAGGTGVQVAAGIVEQAAKMRPLWLAGGLNAGNIADVVKRHHPELVDVSSGVEAAPGRKDADKLRRFFDEVRKL